MKKLLLILYIMTVVLAGNAQQPRAFTMPGIIGQVTAYNEVYRPVTLTGGKAILENDVIIDPDARTLNTISKEDYRFVTQKPYQIVHHSPDGRYRVIVRFAVPKEGKRIAYSKKETDDWNVWGYSTTGADWKFDLRNSDYPLGITNEGEVITTRPKVVYTYSNNLQTFMNLAITSMQGLWLFNPVTGERKLITEDVLYKKGNDQLNISMNQNGELINIAFYSNGKTLSETYDVHTGEHWHVELPVSTFRQIGNDVALVHEFRWGGDRETSVIRVISLKDGHEWLSEPASDSAGFGSDVWCHNLTLYGNDLYFMNRLNYSIARLKPSDGKMVMAGIVQLDTTGLLFKDHSYYLAVLNDYFALLPFNLNPFEAQDPYPIFGYFFDRKGSPALAMRPFFIQPPSAGSIAAKAAAEKKECENYMNASPFPMGALVRKKGEGDCNSSPLIWGVECGYKSYTTVGPKQLWKNFCSAGDYQLCDPGPFEMCTRCNGTGVTKHWTTVSDDGWKQTNFNVYVRNPNGVKGVELEGPCERCGGKKFVRL